MDGMGNTFGLGGQSNPKQEVMNQIRQEAAMTNARQLIEVGSHIFSSPPRLYQMLTSKQKVNEHCFEKCVPKPGASLSSGENTCISQCMEKYMATWNTVSRQYITRIQQESGKGAGGGGMF